ncbi:MAG: alpha/beta hydrolase [Planctomycetaceae bacterium]|nr:alpha/beta hydrolase [Planctomycetaceae bacterium]
MPDIEFARVKTNGISLNVAQSGPESGPLAILLHGFPEFWYGWKKHIPALAAAGYRVWAPDQRGYNTSDKPPLVRDYSLDTLAADVVGLVDAAGRERAILVGHDWGAAVAWWVANNFPERIYKLVIINVPHPLVLRRLLRTSPRQLMRSWYMFLMQLPGLVEWVSRRNNWHMLVEGLKSSSMPGTFTDADFDEYRRAWSRPGAYTAMLNWYRAMFRYGARRPKHERIAPQTLMLWGRHDKFIGPEGAELSLAMCDRGELVMFDDNTHWLQLERPEEVCRRIVEFCR